MKVLVVDDDEIILFLHNMIIKEHGISDAPLSFENGKLALEYVNTQTDKDTAFLVFLDINMPVLNGWQFLDQIQNTPYSKTIFVIMVTSSIDFEDREKASGYSQVIGYIEKPLNDVSVTRIKQLPQIASSFKEA